MSPLSALRAYVAHPDPLAQAANLVAMIVAGNQPFYPLYLYYVVGPPVMPSFWTFLTTPCFMAVPWVARRSSLAGRVMLVVVGTANTILCAKLFGVSSGVELFLLPCLVVAAVLFNSQERIASLAAAGVVFLAFFGLHDRYGMPMHLYTDAEYRSFLSLNAGSVGSLTVFIGIALSNALVRR